MSIILQFSLYNDPCTRYYIASVLKFDKISRWSKDHRNEAEDWRTNNDCHPPGLVYIYYATPTSMCFSLVFCTQRIDSVQSITWDDWSIDFVSSFSPYHAYWGLLAAISSRCWSYSFSRWVTWYRGAVKVIEKAFDTVHHCRLIKKLDTYGIKGELLLWIKIFLVIVHSR